MTKSLLIRLQRPAGDWVDVGVIHHADSRNWFEFVDGYWDDPARPVLGQIFESRQPLPRTHVALPRWFSHLLPEGRLRQAVADAAGVSPVREFELLTILGVDDLPGAIQAIPWDHQSRSAVLDVTPSDSKIDRDNPVLKFSLAGAQLKFSVRETDRGLTVPAQGSLGNLIVKLPDPRLGYDGVPEAEYAAMSLARAVGLDVPATRLIDAHDISGLGRWADVGSGPSYAIDRYDRLGDGRRLHAEDFAQVLDIPTARQGAKYRSANFETVASVAAALTGIEHVGVVIDRIVLNVLVGNGDAHLKNWSVTYPDGMNPELSPVYDVVPTVLYLPQDDLGMKLNGSRSFEDVFPSSFRRMGELTGFGAQEAEKRAADAAMRVLDSWSVLAETLDDARFRQLTERLQALPLAKHERG